MTSRPVHQKLVMTAAIAGAILAASPVAAKDTRTEEPVFEFSTSFASPQSGAAPTFYIWKINRIDGSLYLCQTPGDTVRCNQVAAPNGELGPFSLSDAVNQHMSGNTAGFHVWRLNRWTGTQELCTSSAAQKGCSK